MLVDNDDDLQRELQGLIGLVVGNMANEILFYTKLSVSDVVYEDPKNQPIYYDRLGEDGGFLGSWVAEPTKRGNNSEWVIYSDPEEMIYNPPQHGKDVRYDEIDDTVEVDRRSFMDEAIQEGTDWDYGSSDGEENEKGEWVPKTPYWQKPRDYWNPIIDIVGNPANLEDNVRNAFLEEGIVVIKE